MTRVEAVEEAIRRASEERDASYATIAQAAIEASDAWLADRVGKLGPFKAAPYQATEEMMQAGERNLHRSIGFVWLEMLKAAPDISTADHPT